MGCQERVREVNLTAEFWEEVADAQQGKRKNIKARDDKRF